MLVNQASSTPPTTAASSNQMMPDGAGRLSTSFGQSRGLQMAWRRLPVFRSDIERRFARRENIRRKTMKTTRNWKMVGGWVLHGLIAGIMILAGSAKVLGFFPPEEVAKLGLSLPIQVIGAGELASAILLLIPRTSSLGLLLTSGFWGGAICLHMSKGEPFVLQSALLLFTWVGGYLRVPGAFGSFTAQGQSKQEHARAEEALTV